MSLIFRYILRDYVKIFLICLGAFILAYLAIDFFEKVRKFAALGAPMSLVARYFFLRLPRMVLEVAPVAALLSTLLTLGGLSRNHEFTALKSLGVGPLRLLSPLFSFAVAASLVLLVLNLSVIPGGLRKSQQIRDYQIEKKPHQSDFVQDRVWTKFDATTFSNIQLIDTKKNTLYGVTIYRLTEDFTFPEMIEAKEMRYEGKTWFLYSGIDRHFFEDGSTQIKSFDRLPFPIEKEPKDFSQIQLDEDQMRYWELSRYVDRLAREGYVAPRYEVNLLQKISYPFTTLIMVFLGIPFALNDARSGGLARGIGLSLAVGFLFWLTYSTSLSIGYGGILPPLVAAWLPHLLFLAVGVYFMLTVRW
ncbi:MAG TPA: LPS export ABC transporter permease LptG [Nitrospiria bacterium]|nr:LPS export ABC transporter permease LptG [Nitrospiria bacterium]